MCTSEVKKYVYFEWAGLLKTEPYNKPKFISSKYRRTTSKAWRSLLVGRILTATSTPSAENIKVKARNNLTQSGSGKKMLSTFEIDTIIIYNIDGDER